MFKHRLLNAAMAFMALFLADLTVSAQKMDLSSPIPVDSKVTKGELSNGLTYYIRPNSKPKDKVQLRLVVNAGSLQETDAQQGLAHFMEHMNFNGLKHFPKNELIHYLQDIGVKFGADLNANTGFDRTYFILPIPTDNPENLKNGFQIVADWAGGALISTDQVNDERKVISEELRMRDKTAGTRMMKQFLPKMLNGSRYAERLPSGKDSIVLHADPDLIRQYYHDWYRPNNMAVIVVGDITTKKAKSMIKKYFGSLKNPKNEKERKYYKVKPYTHPEAMVVTDPEATNYSFGLMFPAKEVHPEKTLKDYRESLIRSIFTQTLNHELHKLAQTGNPPYAGAFGSVTGTFGSFTLKNEGFSLNVTPIDNIETAIDSAIAEVLRVREYGFSDNDVSNTKKKMIAYYKKAYNEKDKTLSSALVDEYTRNFMRQEPIPGISNEYEFVQKMLPTITVQEVSDLASDILSNSKNFFALITGPEKGDIDLPSEKELLSMVEKAFDQRVSAKTETEGGKTLLDQAPIPGKVVSQKKDDQLGTTTYTLSNGVKVTVKPTDFKDDEIVFRGSKYGGTGQYKAADKSNANFLTSVISVMGYGDFTPTELKDFLSGKNASVSPNMGQISNNVSGSSSVEDFETLLELNYLKLTEPRKDEDLYKGFLTKMKTQLKFAKSNPQAAFVDTLVKVMYDNSPLAPIAVPSEEDLNKINVDRVLEMYKNQFGNADGFHFFIVGNVDESTLKPLMEKYLASLPTKGEKPMYKDNGLRMHKGDKTFKFYKGTDDKSLILSQIHGDNVKYSEDLALKTDLLGDIMTMQINDTIREKMQVIYSGGARASLSELPYPHYTIMMQLPTGPKSVDVILKEIDKEIKGYKANGGPKGSLHKAKKAALEEHKEDLKKNSYWASKLEDLMLWKKSKNFFLNYDKEIEAITEKDMMDTAKKLLNGDRFTAISYPEKSKDE